MSGIGGIFPSRTREPVNQMSSSDWFAIDNTASAYAIGDQVGSDVVEITNVVDKEGGQGWVRGFQLQDTDVILPELYFFCFSADPTMTSGDSDFIAWSGSDDLWMFTIQLSAAYWVHNGVTGLADVMDQQRRFQCDSGSTSIFVVPMVFGIGYTYTSADSLQCRFDVVSV